MSTFLNQTGQRSFDDLYNDIWRPQSIAALYVNNNIQPDMDSMSELQQRAYHDEVYRLNKLRQIRMEIANAAAVKI